MQELAELPLHLFEARYVELARRAERHGQFGYAETLQRRKGGRGMLVSARNFRWMGPQGPVVVFAKPLQRFRVVALRHEAMKEGEPLYTARVQLLADRDLSRMRAGDKSSSGIYGHLAP